MAPLLRPLADADIPELTALERLVLADQDPELWAEFHDNMMRHFDERVALARENGAFLVLVNEDGAIVAGGGYAVGGGGEPELVKIRTHPDHRRRGYARTLVSALESHAAQAGFSVMTLDTNEKNTSARAFYESMGYALDRIEPTFPWRAAAYYRKSLLPYDVRLAVESDFEELAAIEKLTAREYRPERFRIKISAALSARVLFVATVEDRIVGMAGAWCLPDWDGPEIMLVRVHPDFRRRGIASVLVTQVERALRAQGHSTVLLYVYSDNASAIALYEKLGYAWDGTEEDYGYGGSERGYRKALA